MPPKNHPKNLGWHVMPPKTTVENTLIFVFFCFVHGFSDFFVFCFASLAAFVFFEFFFVVVFVCSKFCTPECTAIFFYVFRMISVVFFLKFFVFCCVFLLYFLCGIGIKLWLCDPYPTDFFFCVCVCVCVSSSLWERLCTLQPYWLSGPPSHFAKQVRGGEKGG